MYGMNPQMMPQYQNNSMNNYNSYLSQLNQMQQAQPQTLTRVTGIDGARAYQMNANSTVALFDNNEDLMYIKTTDGAGFPTIRTFAFSEVFDNKPQISNEDYVSKNEFETFKQEVTDYVQQFIQQTTAKQAKQTISTNGISEQLGKSRDSIQTRVSE